MTAAFPLCFLSSLQFPGKKEDPMDTILENIEYVINMAQSTRSTLHIVRKKTVKHRVDGYGTWLEEVEDSFTIPVGSLDIKFFLRNLGDRSVNTSILQRSLFILRKLVKYFTKIPIYCMKCCISKIMASKQKNANFNSFTWGMHFKHTKIHLLPRKVLIMLHHTINFSLLPDFFIKITQTKKRRHYNWFLFIR
jgi:hypothetical protein